MALVNKTNKLNDLESLLFYFNESVPIKKLAKLLRIDEAEVNALLNELKEGRDQSGLQIIVSNHEAQMVARVTDEDLLDQLDEIKQTPNLTPAVVETLAVVAYLGSASEDQVDTIRGVRSNRTIKRLIRRGYLTTDKNKKLALTTDAMQQLGIESTSNLSELETTKLKLSALLNNDN